MPRLARAALCLVPVLALPVLSRSAAAEDTPWRAGARVSCNWEGRGTFYDGMVLGRMGSQLKIAYTDGSLEILEISMCRLVGPAEGQTEGQLGGFHVGSRVSCNWQEEGPFYTGQVDMIIGEQLRVLYDEGDEELTSPRLCRAVTAGGDGRTATDGFVPGARVECDWQSRGTFHPALIESRVGNDLAVRYDDGTTEQTTTGRCRTR